MKKKVKLILYIFGILLLAHLILVAGCGKNPLLGIIGTGLSVGVGRL